VLPGLAVTAQTQRKGGAAAQGQHSHYAPYLQAITLRQIMGILFQPKTPGFAQDTFGVQVEQPMMVYADWPTTTSDIMPIKTTDMILVNGVSYIVRGVRNFPSQHIEILVELPE